MKKKILFVALLIISILTIDNIYAATPSTSFYATVRSVGRDGADTNCRYTANTGHYNTNIFKIKVSNVEYDAFCIDPGKGIPGGNLTCEMMDSSSYPMIYASLLNQSLMGEGQLVKDIVFRTLGIMERQSLVFTETGSTGEFNTNKNNVILTLLWAHKVSEHGIAINGPSNFDYPKGGVWDTAGGYIGNAIQYWTGNYTGDRTPPPTNTENLAGIKETSGLIGNYFRLEKLSTDPANPRYRVTTLSGGQAAEVVISGVDGTAVSVEQPWDGTMWQKQETPLRLVIWCMTKRYLTERFLLMVALRRPLLPAILSFGTTGIHPRRVRNKEMFILLLNSKTTPARISGERTT
jgi:hypothetical protein